MRKIVIAGCGHGGLVVAGILAKNGYDVSVYEKKSKDNLAHDWTDIFNINSLENAGVTMPDASLYSPKEPMTFVNPSKTKHLKTTIPAEFMEMKMERSDILDVLLNFATLNGAKIYFDNEIIAPLIEENIIQGVILKDEKIKADLVIDAAGVASVVRQNMPQEYSLTKNHARGEQFFVYRAFYKKNNKNLAKYKYKVYLYHLGKLGISWTADEDDYIDILIARIDPFDKKDIQEALIDLKTDNPSLSFDVIRGGQIVPITVRRPMPIFVGRNYAAIGDAAAMSIPLIGSGIANSIDAGKMLADTIIEIGDNNFSIENLWSYQVKYFKSKYAHAGLDLLKTSLFNISKDDVDFAFEKGLLNGKDLSYIAAGQEIQLSFKDLVSKGVKGLKNLKLLLVLSKALFSSKMLAKHAKNIPNVFSQNKISKWASKYVNYK